MEGNKRVEISGGGREGEARTQTKGRARGVKQNVVERFGEEAFDDGQVVFIAGGGSEEGGGLGGGEGAGATQGFGEDGVGGVEDDGGEAGRHAHCLAESLEFLHLFAASIAGDDQTFSTHEADEVGGFAPRTGTQVYDAAPRPGGEDVPYEERWEVLGIDNAGKKAVERRGLRADAVRDADAQAFGGGEELGAGDDGSALSNEEGFSSVVAVEATTLRLSVQVHEQKNAAAGVDSGARAPNPADEDIGAT